MASKKDRKADRHKPRRMAGIRERLAQQLERLAAKLDSDFTHEANRAVRELLEREGFWPPSDDDD